MRYGDVVAGYLRHLKRSAERVMGEPLHRVVLGRPVHFVDDDPARDAQAQNAWRLQRARWVSRKFTSSSSPSPQRWTTKRG